MAINVEVEVKGLKAEASATDEVTKAVKVGMLKQSWGCDSLQIKMKNWRSRSASTKLRWMQWRINSDNLQKITSLALEAATKENWELKSQVGELTAEIDNLK